jgi:FYVE/RhoGEF/PH domain-containing protein 5/6
VFSNFIDIWNLHRAFFSSLHEHLHPNVNPEAPTQLPSSSPPHLSPILLSHFPYLSLYTPFVTSFSASLVALTTFINTNTSFSAFIARQEADPRCGKLKLRDWLLTIVQRCPRYLLLLKDLINCTDVDDPEYSSLMSVHALVSKSMWCSEFPFINQLIISSHDFHGCIAPRACSNSWPSSPPA